MVLVMFVIGLMAALVGPRIAGQIEHMERQAQRQELEDQLRQLPRRVRLAGRPIELPRDLALTDPSDGERLLAVPSGWDLRFDPPLLIAANGACSSSIVHITYPLVPEAAPERYRIAELTCELAANPA